jgi:hypothetical protein
VAALLCSVRVINCTEFNVKKKRNLFLKCYGREKNHVFSVHYHIWACFAYVTHIYNVCSYFITMLRLYVQLKLGCVSLTFHHGFFGR